MFRKPELVKLLDIDPKSGTGHEEIPETQSGIAGNRCLTAQYRLNRLRGYPNLMDQFRRAHIQFVQLIAEMFAGVYGRAFHAGRLAGRQGKTPKCRPFR